MLRAQQVGFAIQWVPLVMIVMSLAYSLSAYPAGILSDRVNRRYLLAAGIVLLTWPIWFSPGRALRQSSSLAWPFGGCTWAVPEDPCRHDRRGDTAGIEGDGLWPI